MDWMSFSIGMLGIISTLVISLFGFYLNHKERISNHRIEFFKIQLELLEKILLKLNEAENAAESYRFHYESEKSLQCNQELFNCYRGLKEIAYNSSVILPTETFTSLVRIEESIENLINTFFEKDNSVATLYDKFTERCVVFSRALFGVDAISNENYKLFSRPNFKFVFNQLMDDY